MDGAQALSTWLERVLTGDSPIMTASEWWAFSGDFSDKVSLVSFDKRTVHIPNRVYYRPGSEELMKKSHYTESDCDGNSLRAQADFVLSALGADAMERVVLGAILNMNMQLGGAIYKEGKTEGPAPEEGEIEEYASYLLASWIAAPRGFSFDTKKWAKGVVWKKNVIYRFEAIISSLYVMMRIAGSPGSYEEALRYQRGDYFQNNFLVRLKKGQARALKVLNAPIPDGFEDGDPMIRHIHPSTFFEMLTSIMME